MLDTFPYARFEAGGRYQINAGAEDGFQVGLDPAEPEQAQPGGQVRKQVHVTIGAVLAAGDAAKHPQVADSMSGRSGDHFLAVAAHPATHGTGQPA